MTTFGKAIGAPEHVEDSPTSFGGASRGTGNRYARYSANAFGHDVTLGSSIAHGLAQPSHSRTKRKDSNSNNGYKHSDIHSSFHNSLHYTRPTTTTPKASMDDHDNASKELLYGSYSADPSMLRMMESNHVSVASPDTTAMPTDNSRAELIPNNNSNNSSSSRTSNRSGKWRSRRAEQLKQNPHQKHPYSSNPIPSNRSETSPTLYKDSQFTRFAQEQLTTNTNSDTPNNNSNNNSNHNSNSGTRHTPTEEDDLHPNISHNSSHNVNNNNQSTVTVVSDNAKFRDKYEELHQLARQSGERWFYRDPSGKEQGPFDRYQMAGWFRDGYFSDDLPVRCNESTPFVELKDWFFQGMTAFLDYIPTQWPQTLEPVIIDPQHAPNTASNSVKTAAKTPVMEPNTADDREEEKQHRTADEYNFSRQNIAKHPAVASVGVGLGLGMGVGIGMGLGGTNRQRTKRNNSGIVQAESTASQPEDEENTTTKSSVDDSLYGNTPTRMASIHPRPQTDTTTTTNTVTTNDIHSSEAIHYYLQNEEEEQLARQDVEYPLYGPNSNNTVPKVTTPPPTVYNTTEAQSNVVHSRAKLTPVSAYDRNLAATPPAQRRQYRYYTHVDQHYEEEYNYTPSTNPKEDGEDMMPLFRSHTDPTDYNAKEHQYHLFASQDLFANGRRHLQATNAESKFNANSYTHNTQQGQSHRKYDSVTRDRKPPIRHKWPQPLLHNVEDVVQDEEEEMEQLERSYSVEEAPTKPPQPSRSTRYANTTEQMNDKKNKKRKRRKKKPSQAKVVAASSASCENGSNGNGNSKKNVNSHINNAWGANQMRVKPSFNDLQAEDAHKQQQLKSKQRENLMRRQHLMKQQKMHMQQPVHRPVEGDANNPWQTSQTAKEVLTRQVKTVPKQKLLMKKPQPLVHTNVNMKSKPKKNGNMTATNTASAAVAGSWSSKAKSRNVKGLAAQPNHIKRTASSPATTASVDTNKNVKKKTSTKQNGKNSKSSSNNNNGKANHRSNVDALSKVSGELQHWLRTEIKKLNPDVEAASVAHVLLTLSDENTVKTTAYHTFGKGKAVTTFVDSFLIHRRFDLQQHKNQNKAAQRNHTQQKKKNKRKSRR